MWRSIHSSPVCSTTSSIPEPRAAVPPTRHINTREYLEDELTRLPAMKAKDAASLTPAKWLAPHSPKADRLAQIEAHPDARVPLS